MTSQRMMAASSQEKFNAAVKVIRGLPKNGSFQPSHELMLKFYAYFKQATEGPCTAPKPGIWSIVNRRKWEAWSDLGQMEKEKAMLLYVEELKNVSKHVKETLYPPEIVETMPQTEKVAEFVDTLGAFYELIDDGDKVVVSKPNGSVNGEGDSQADHSATIGEMLKINNNDAKKGHGDINGDSPDRDRAPGLNGMTANGHKETTDEEEEEEEEEDEEEEEEEEEEKGVVDTTRLDSGSDSEEFCDSSDQMIQIPTKAPGLAAAAPQVNTSTPVDSKREARVRFAAHVDRSDLMSVNSCGNGLDLTDALQDLSAQSQEMLTERLGLGTAIGLSFLPHSTEFPPRQLTESLHVNNSFNSLASLVGSDSVAGDLGDDGAALEREELTQVGGRCDLVTSRGGGEDQGPSSQGSQGSYPSGRGGLASSSQGGRDTGRSRGGSTRRGLFPPGSGGGGQRRGGESRQFSGSLEEQILLTLIRLQQDMTDISNRLASLELIVKLQREEQAKKAIKQSGWWPFPGVSKKVAFLLIIWPFLAPFLINLICRRRRSAPR